MIYICLLEGPFGTQCRHCFEAFFYKVVRQFQFAANTQLYIFPFLDFVEVNPELGLGKEDELCSLPNTGFTPEVGKTAK